MMRRLFVPLFLLLSLPAVPAEAVTVKEIIDLTRAGLSEEVLLALIEVDQRVFSIDAATLKELKAAGVAERVIVAMVRSGRARPEPAAAGPLNEPEALPPQVVVIEREPVVREVAVPVAVPIYVPILQRVRDRHVELPVNPAVPLPVQPIGSFPVQQPRVSQPAPVYWGWGGKLRPDAWKPTPPDPPRPPDR